MLLAHEVVHRLTAAYGEQQGTFLLIRGMFLLLLHIIRKCHWGWGLGAWPTSCSEKMWWDKEIQKMWFFPESHLCALGSVRAHIDSFFMQIIKREWDKKNGSRKKNTWRAPYFCFSSPQMYWLLLEFLHSVTDIHLFNICESISHPEEEHTGLCGT